jgi:hypothetical protein
MSPGPFSSQWPSSARAVSTDLYVSSWDHYRSKYSIIYLMRIDDTGD